jgi:hypothetical protein
VALDTYLAWNHSSIEWGITGNIEHIIMRSMNIDGEILAMTPKEPLPQRQQWQRSSSQKHESNFRYSIKGIPFLLWQQRSPPKDLIVSHAMNHVVWMNKPLHIQKINLLTRLHNCTIIIR